MSINGKSIKSVRRKDLTTQKTPFVAFKSFQFAHQASAGDTTISLTALVTPTSYSSAGFIQPSVSDLQAANLLLYKRNLQLISSLRGVLLEYDAYQIVGSSTIRLNFEAEANEIFVGTISDVAKDGLQVIDGKSLVSTGVLSANQSDYVVGQSFTRNKFPTAQVGDVLVFIGGELAFRNAGNATASVSADGNYEEVDGGSGLSNTIRFNIVDPVNDRPIVVLSNGMLAERPNGSLRAEIESLAGQMDAVIETLAVVAGVPETNFQAAPNDVDLQTFGKRVIDLENEFPIALVSTSNPGLMPSLTGSLDNATATQLGLKTYYADKAGGGNDIAYYNSVKATISPSTNMSVIGNVRGARLIPYQTQAGEWRLKITLYIDSLTTSSATGHSVTINGVTFKNATNWFQGMAGQQDVGTVVSAYAAPNTSRLDIVTSAVSTPTGMGWSGDVELDSKPTWAY
ncbi:MAG: hypothetical protein RIR02_1496 [Pseudomonadota bacterium]|jgi:hypothetical protein